MRAVHLDEIAADGVGPAGGGDEIGGQFRDILRRHLPRGQPAVVQRNGRGADHFPRHIAARPVFVIHWTIAKPGPLHRRLPPGMGELDAKGRAIGAHEIRNGFQRLGMSVRPEADIAMGDAPARLHRRRLRHHPAEAAGGEFRQMREMPFVRDPVLRRILAHGRQHGAVAKRHPAQRDRGKEFRLGHHAPPATRLPRA